MRLIYEMIRRCILYSIISRHRNMRCKADKVTLCMFKSQPNERGIIFYVSRNIKLVKSENLNLFFCIGIDMNPLQILSSSSFNYYPIFYLKPSLPRLLLLFNYPRSTLIPFCPLKQWQSYFRLDPERRDFMAHEPRNLRQSESPLFANPLLIPLAVPITLPINKLNQSLELKITRIAKNAFVVRSNSLFSSDDAIYTTPVANGDELEVVSQ